MSKAFGNYYSDVFQTGGPLRDVISPVSNEVIGRVPLVDKTQIMQAITAFDQAAPLARSDVFAFIERLKSQIQSKRKLLLDMNHLETGFIERDNEEVIDALIEYLDEFEESAQEIDANGENENHSLQLLKHSYRSSTTDEPAGIEIKSGESKNSEKMSGEKSRFMRLVKKPYHGVAVLVPQNANLGLALISIVSALYAGAGVIIRPSLQCGVTGAILAELIESSEPPSNRIAVVNASANEFLTACYEAEGVELIHYIGSDRYAKTVLNDAFGHGKVALIDGEGNGFLYVDRDYPLEQAVEIIVNGATRYNGETCTSVNGVLVERSRYDELEQALVDAFSGLKVGHPRSEESQVGPLFSAQQAEGLLDLIADTEKGRVLCGGFAEGGYFSPTIVTGISPRDRIVRDGVFGPAIWLHGIDESDLWQWLARNHFPLCDTILSHNTDLIQTFVTRSRAARICINQDPSVESMFEPWGGYPPGGSNPVSVWTEKYLKTIQLDGCKDDILRI